MTNLPETVYKPDILSCLSDLSNDEVITPPELANAMLDLLPKEIWNDPTIRILDPACKSGVFLREAAKRFIEGEKEIIPNLQERIDHIMHNQLFGIAITEITSLMARRSLYCSKYPNGPYSISLFDNSEGNIRFKRINHKWNGDKCEFCGASKEQYNRSKDLETHAYEFIHISNVKELENMKFDVICGNPPYQLSDNGNGVSAKPIYQEFVEMAKKLNPSYLTMIIPSRWFNGGKGLDRFRANMLSDKHISHLVDYQNAKDCFPGVSIGGGVCYFLWEKSNTGDCEITNMINGRCVTMTRPLDQYPVFVRYNDSVDIIQKVQNQGEESLVNYMSSRNPFGMPTSFRGSTNKSIDDLTLFSSKGKSYITRLDVAQGIDSIDKYKVMISRVTSEHAGEPDKSGMYKVIANIKLLKPQEVCTDSYILAYPTNDETKARNCYEYLRTKFVRFLLLQALSSINLSRESYSMVPCQDFSINWTDEKLYVKYGLTEEEISFIESMIKPMELDGD